MTLLDRFLHYVSFDTQSDPFSKSFPSSSKQLLLLKALEEEMIELGLVDVTLDEYGYVMGSIPATVGFEKAPVLGFIAHVDTSPDASGSQIKPQIIKNYDGKDIQLGKNGVMKVEEFPELKYFQGHTLITTDGTTLLGADDKAGVAEIMTMAEYLLQNPQIAHGKIRIAFTPDEEVGRGVDYFDVAAFGAEFAYTVDGGFEGELEYENFNAAKAFVAIQGRNIHPGSAKGKMINALQVAQDFHALLPNLMRPELTEGYQGFMHLHLLSGDVEKAEMHYIIRDHDKTLFEEKKQLFRDAQKRLNDLYGKEIISCSIEDQYYNMKEKVEPHPDLIELASSAMKLVSVTPIIKPIRGGTDGCRLSYMGLPCPNLFAGGMNFHGRYEYCSLQSMHKAVKTLIYIASLWGKKRNLKH